MVMGNTLLFKHLGRGESHDCHVTTITGLVHFQIGDGVLVNTIILHI